MRLKRILEVKYRAGNGFEVISRLELGRERGGLSSELRFLLKSNSQGVQLERCWVAESCWARYLNDKRRKDGKI